ncbi:MAG TPA: hypothetical protein VH375_08710 [Rhodanobacteraceae bacterium]
MRPVHAIAFATLGIFFAPAAAQSAGGPYAITESAIGGGAATLSGGSFRLNGTLGQPATASLAAAGYRFYDGFWTPATPPGDRIFANGFDP